jgi:hypothetical protein
VKYLLVTVAAVFSFAQQPSKPVATGPAIGARVPDFKALDAEGRVQTLKSVMGSKGALLVFFRSADW